MGGYKDLKERFPKLLEGCRYASCGDGWYNIVESICILIQGHIDNQNQHIEWVIRQSTDPSIWCKEPIRIPEAPIQPVITCIKEKFGTLRVYYTNATEFTEGVVRMAEQLSSRTCETCGNPGTVITDKGWYKTACELHK